jgi:hypothetical protein
MRSLLLSQVYLGRVAKRHAECIRNETNTKIMFLCICKYMYVFRAQNPEARSLYFLRIQNPFPSSKEYSMIYRRPGFLAIVSFVGFTPPPRPPLATVGSASVPAKQREERLWVSERR